MYSFHDAVVVFFLMERQVLGKKWQTDAKMAKAASGTGRTDAGKGDSSRGTISTQENP